VIGRRVHALLVLVSATLAGCASDPTTGWSTGSTFPEHIETVAVPIAQNDTFERGLEFELTDALIKEIQTRTPYVVASRSRADSILVAQIRDVELQQLSKSSNTGLSEEVLVGVTIDFEWRELTTDTSLVKREEFTGHALFVPSTPTGERIELGRIAVVQKLASDMVDEMRASW
jgi:hypothetical protein